MGLRVFGESYPMNTNMTRWFSKKNPRVLVLRTKLASALEGLKIFADVLRLVILPTRTRSNLCFRPMCFGTTNLHLLQLRTCY